MKTLTDAQCATALARRRRHLLSIGHSIYEAPMILFAGSDERSNKDFLPSPENTYMIQVEVLTDNFRRLVFEEVQAQVANIDAELRALGIDPAAINSKSG